MRILIIKIGALGDVLRTSFIAQALKDKYKNKNPEVFWITSPTAKPLLSNNPYIDEIILPNEKSKIKNTEFDLVINLEEDKDNTSFTSSINSNKKIGFLIKDGEVFPTKTAKEWFDMSLLGKKPENDILKKKNKKTHRQIMGEIVEVEWEKYEPFLRLRESQRRIKSNFLRRYNLSEKDLIIGINSGSADRWPKDLPPKMTAKLINESYNKYNAKILLFGGPNEIERNKEIKKYLKVPIVDAGCGNDLVEFPALVSACNLFITTDSLGLHIALALKRKTIALIGPTSPAEIDMYGLGDKIVSKSKDVCSYKTKTKCMEKIDLNAALKSIENLLKQRMTILITAFKEPKTIGKAIESALNQKTVHDYNVIISAPDKETLDVAGNYAGKDKRLNLIQDPGKGKSYALNLIFNKIKTDILILTDGDVFISENAVEEIANKFSDPEVGCVTGRPVPIEDRKTKYGYWANFLFDAAHKIRLNSHKKNSFIECSGYLFAFRKNKIKSIPLDVAEDTLIPYNFWEKGYRISYAEKAEVFVKNVDNWRDWINQKARTSKAHETLEKYVDTKTTPRVKTFKNEAGGIRLLISYPDNFKEFIWTMNLVIARFYMWANVFLDTKIKDKAYKDAWQRVDSTK